MRTHLVDQVLSAQIGKMRSFLVIRKIRTDATSHSHYERLIGHVHPVASTNKLAGGIPHEWAV